MARSSAGASGACRGEVVLPWHRLPSSSAPTAKQAGCFLPMFGFSLNDPSLGQLQEEQWQNKLC